jgi:hypothetical protein
MVQKACGGGRAKSLKTVADQNLKLTGAQSKDSGPSTDCCLEASFTLLPTIGELGTSQAKVMRLIRGPVVGWISRRLWPPGGNLQNVSQVSGVKALAFCHPS